VHLITVRDHAPQESCVGSRKEPRIGAARVFQGDKIGVLHAKPATRATAGEGRALTAAVEEICTDEWFDEVTCSLRPSENAAGKGAG